MFSSVFFFRLSVGNATKGFATYGCFHPCFYTIDNAYFRLGQGLELLKKMEKIGNLVVKKLNVITKYFWGSDPANMLFIKRKPGLIQIILMKDIFPQ